MTLTFKKIIHFSSQQNTWQLKTKKTLNGCRIYSNHSILVAHNYVKSSRWTVQGVGTVSRRWSVLLPYIWHFNLLLESLCRPWDWELEKICGWSYSSWPNGSLFGYPL